MNLTFRTLLSHPRAWTVLLAAFVLTACVQAPGVPDATPLERAATELSRALVAQLDAPAGARSGLVLDPMLEAAGGQQTSATRDFGAALAARLARADAGRLSALPFEAGTLSRAAYLLTGTFTRSPSAPGEFRVHVALTDLATGTVAAQASTLLRDERLDSAPLAYFRDSPVLVQDAVFDGYVRTSATPRGQRADPVYLERLAAAPVIERAQTLYGQEKFQDALEQYRALDGPAAEQLRVLTGVYLANWRLGRRDEAEQAFGRIVALGIAYRQLGVKFLFKPGTTDFWPDPEVSGSYPMWLRQIASESRRAGVCMDVVGHTSRTGGAAYNDNLSLQRASRMQQMLVERAGELGARVRPSGKGYRENLVGSGTDDALDALDRRVEFRIVPCS